MNYLTINVSEFYRNPDQWQILDKDVFPQLIDTFGEQLTIWSAACSTGDEPYSLVMALSRHIPLSKIKILATDIDKQVLAAAKNGIYAEKSLIGVPADLKAKYFTKVGASYRISDEIKSRVEFKEHNLLRDPYPTNVNLIVCRNVLIYFDKETQEKVNALGLKEYVKFLGQRSDANELYQAFDVFLLPSLYEGLGMVAVEGQVAGLPCICSTEVPNVAKICGNCKFIKLEDNKSIWNDTILNSINKVNRVSYVKEAKNCGFDINIEVSRLENKYLGE